MQTPESAPSSLHIGIVSHDHILCERHVDGSRTVSIGRAGDNTLQVDARDCPEHFALVEQDHGHYRLNFTNEMRGAVRLGRGQLLTLDELAEVAEHAAGQNRIELPEGSAACIEFGDDLHVVLELEPTPAPARTPPPLLYAAMVAFALALLALAAALEQPRPIVAPSVHATPVYRLPEQVVTIPAPENPVAVPPALEPPPEAAPADAPTVIQLPPVTL